MRQQSFTGWRNPKRRRRTPALRPVMLIAHPQRQTIGAGIAMVYCRSRREYYWGKRSTNMGQQVKELFDWARRRKILASAFVALTLTVGILIGSVVSGRVSAMKTFSFAGTNATPLAVPDPIPSGASFASIVNRVEPAVVNIATTQV